MKKRNLLRLLAILLAFAMLLTACGNTSKHDSRDDDEDEEEEEEEEDREEREEETEEKPGQSLMWGTTEEPAEEASDAEEETSDAGTQQTGIQYWDNVEAEMSLTFYGDGTGLLTDLWNEVEITYTREGASVALYDASSDVEYGTMQPDGSIQFESLDTPFVPVAEAGYTPSTEQETTAAETVTTFTGWSVEATYNYHLVGHWTHYSHANMTLDFDGVQNVTYNLGSRTGTGQYHFDGHDLEIVTQDNELLGGYLDWEGDIWLDAYDGWFIADREDYFKENNLDPDWFADGYSYLSDTGARYYLSDGSQYVTAPLDCEIIQNSEVNTHDGFRELDYTVYCGFLEEYNPQLEGEYGYGCQFGVFDAYTGYMLTIDNAYYDAASDAFVYEYTSGDRTVRMECGYDTLWETDVDGYEFRLTVNISIRLPDNYDGARIVILGSRPTFAEQNAGYPIELVPYTGISEISEGLVFKIN